MREVGIDDELRQMVAALAEEVRGLRAEIDRRRRDEPMSADAAGVTADVDSPAVTSRRGLLALAGGAAAVAAGAVLGGSQPAAAANLDPIEIAATTAATGAVTRTLVDYSQTSGPGDYFVVTDSAPGSTPTMDTVLGAYNAVGPNNVAVFGQSTRNNGVGVTGQSTGSTGGIGVYAHATGSDAIAVFAVAQGAATSGVYAYCGGTKPGHALVAESIGNPDMVANGTGGVWLRQRVAVGPPTTAFIAGEIVRDGKNDIWVCTGTSPVQWRRVATVDDLTATNAQVASVAAQATALSAQVGAIAHPASFVLITPTRVYDSRLPTQPPGNTGGTIETGQNRVVSIANGIDLDSGAVSVANVVPAGATGIVCNFTVAGPRGGGFLAMTPGDASALSASTINWTAGTANLANAATVKLDSNRQVKVFAGGGASTDFIIDIAGYYI